MGYFLSHSSGYVLNLQSYGEIQRNLYDSNFKHLVSYRTSTEPYTLVSAASFIPVFATELSLANKVYEVYSTERKILVVYPDFENRSDSIVYTLDLKAHHKDERRLAVFPFSRGVRVISYSPKQDKLFLYQWTQDGQADTTSVKLPESSLSDDEEEKLTKYARVKYKQSLDNMIVSSAQETSVVANAGTNSIFYNEDKVWLLSLMTSFGGYNVLEYDIRKGTLKSLNFLVNDMKKNSDSKPETIKIPYPTISGNHLIIRNSSFYHFEYLIYDLNSGNKVNSFTAGPDESLRKLLHSNFKQKGTWLSGSDEKEIENEKAFLRKLSTGRGFVYVCEISEDSITLTTGSLKATEGMGGLLFSVATGMLSSMANFTIGDYQIIPYLTTYRNKLSFAHSRFSLKDYQPSKSTEIASSLDRLLESFEDKRLGSTSSFVMEKLGSYFLAVYNPDSRKFEIFRMN